MIVLGQVVINTEDLNLCATKVRKHYGVLIVPRMCVP